VAIPHCASDTIIAWFVTLVTVTGALVSVHDTAARARVLSVDLGGSKRAARCFEKGGIGSSDEYVPVIAV
jgi:hypothetical protein